MAEIKKFVFMLFAMMALTGSCSVAHAASTETTLEPAAAYYAKGDFDKAAELFDALIERGQIHSAIYYNAGNAHLKAGRPVQALLRYERAARLAPRDKDLLWNIQIAKRSFQDRIVDATVWWLKPLLNLLFYVRLDELGVAFLVATLIWFLGSLVLWFQPTVRGFSQSLLIAAWLFVPLTGVFLGVKLYETKDPQVVITQKEVLARYGPSERETKAFALHEGAQGRITDRSRDWYYVTLVDNHAGWIPKNSCEIV